MPEVEKVGITEIWAVSHYGSGYFLRIPKNLVDDLGLQPGDRLRIKIEELTRVGKRARRAGRMSNTRN